MLNDLTIEKKIMKKLRFQLYEKIKKNSVNSVSQYCNNVNCLIQIKWKYLGYFLYLYNISF